MRRKSFFIVFMAFALGAFSFIGCGESESSDETAYFDGNEHYHPSGNYMTSDGYYFLDENGMLHFFDFAAQEMVYVCDKPECSHISSNEGGDGTCNAEINTISGITVYGGLFIILRKATGIMKQIYGKEILTGIMTRR